jgi:hypothetical protein
MSQWPISAMMTMIITVCTQACVQLSHTMCVYVADDVQPLPPMPPLPDDFQMTIEINMFTHNSSYYIQLWQVGNLTRIDYESGYMVGRVHACVRV